jgi:2-isopropylmalate synthase
VLPDEMWEIFSREYLLEHQPSPRLTVADYAVATVDGKVEISAAATVDGDDRRLVGTGNGPIDAFAHALSDAEITVRVLDYAEHALSSGGDAQAAAYVEADVNGTVVWGVGIDANIVTASLRAVVAAINRVD